MCSAECKFVMLHTCELWNGDNTCKYGVLLTLFDSLHRFLTLESFFSVNNNFYSNKYTMIKFSFVHQSCTQDFCLVAYKFFYLNLAHNYITTTNSTVIINNKYYNGDGVAERITTSVIMRAVTDSNLSHGRHLSLSLGRLLSREKEKSPSQGNRT